MMTKLKTWLGIWGPVLTVAGPILTAAFLWWAAGYFITKEAHARDLEELRAEAIARWTAHAEFVAEVRSGIDHRQTELEKSYSTARTEYRDIMAMLALIREDVAALKATQKINDSGTRKNY